MQLTENEIDSYIKKIANSGDGLAIDESYPCQKEFDLLKKQPSDVVPRIRYHLNSFAYDGGSSVGCPTWYYGGKHLIRLLAKMNTDESLKLIADTLKMKSNIAEWYWKIQRQSAIELGNTGDKKWLGLLNDSLKDSMAPIDEINQAIEKISNQSDNDSKLSLENKESQMNDMDKNISDSVEGDDSVNDDKQLAGRVNPFAVNEDTLDDVQSDSESTEKIDDIQPDSESKDKSDVKKSNNTSDEKELSKKDQIKSDYLKSLNKSLDTHTKEYDSKLVEVSDDGDITDYNKPVEVLKHAGKYYAIIIVLLLVIFGIFSLVRGLIPTMIVCICVLFIIACALLLIIASIDGITSSRDVPYKLISSINVLPLLLLFIFSVIIIGFIETLMVIGAILLIGFLGFIALSVCGWSK